MRKERKLYYSTSPGDDAVGGTNIFEDEHYIQDILLALTGDKQKIEFANDN